MTTKIILASGFSFFAAFTLAQTPASDVEISSRDLEDCLSTSVVGADISMTVKELKNACILLLENKARTQEIEAPASENITPTPEKNNSGLQERLAIEALNRSSRFMLTPHKRNYILPLSYKHDPNPEPYIDNDSRLLDLKHAEAEFQLSVKILLREGIFDDNGHLYLGYTNRVFWQVYNRDSSAPFRETNHQPELILSFDNDWEIFGFRNVLNEGIINHQSNGQSGNLSRSWNRLMFNTVFEKDNLVVAFTPWYRLPESEKKTADDARGDDNPDIEKFMGSFELSSAYKRNNDIYSILLRNNLRSENKGAIELGWSFPISSRSQNLRGYVKYFNGYGHSLIDYNDHTQMLGLGVVFTDLF